MPRLTGRSAALWCLATLLALLGSCAPGTDDLDPETGESLEEVLSGCSPSAILANTPLERRPIIERGLRWIRLRIMYSQVSTFEGHRQDCSGFTSMSWGLAKPGRTTSTLYLDSHKIGWNELLPGDALNRASDHVMVFGGWLDRAHTRACILQENATGTPANVRNYPMSYVGTYTPIRFDHRPPGVPADGLYCGGHRVSGSERTLYRLTNGTSRVADQCAAGCQRIGDGGNDRCGLPPAGALTAASCLQVTGNAADPNVPSQSIDVDLYFDGPAGRGTHRTRVRANGAGHSFRVATPPALRDGRAHTVYGYAIGAVGQGNALLARSPERFTCPLVRGALDDVQCDRVAGWAADPNADTPVAVDLYLDGPAGSGARKIRLTADDRISGSCTPPEACTRRLSIVTPPEFHDGRAHKIYAYGNSAIGGPTDPQLTGSPATVHCPLARTGDFDGNGRDDVVQFRGDWPTVPVCYSLGTGWSCQNLAARDGATSVITDGATPLLGDFSADGRADLVQFDDASAFAPLCTSLGSGWSCQNLRGSFAGGEGGPGNDGSGIYSSAEPLVGDFDGDGRDDLLQFDPRWNTIPVCLSLGTGWSCKNLRANYVGGDAAAGNDGSAVYAGTRPLVGDFNGDGRADLAQFATAAGTIPLCLSLGTGWSCRNLRAHYVGGAGAGLAGTGVYAGGTPLVGDFNGDGRDDIAEFDPASSSIPVCLSLGTGWSCQNLPASYVGGDLAAGNAGTGIYTDAVPLVGDFNHDGLADLIQYRPGEGALPVCLSLGTGWSCRGLRAADAMGTVGVGGVPLAADFDGDGRTDVLRYQFSARAIPVCLSLGTGWSCRGLDAALPASLGR